MPRLSLWRPTHSKDYQFFDKNIFEQFTVGATDINVHKYLGTIDQGTSDDATKPSYTNQSEKNIQDLLFLENRDRKYDTSIYTLRGHYRINDNDFDLSQFGLFLTSDTKFLVVHLNDMVQHLGRKLIVGDVIELPHLKDYYPLDGDLPAALKRYYVVQDASYAAEGFAPTWFPHLWRVKLQPLVDSQEYKDILNNITVSDDSTDTLGQLLSTYDRYIDINDAIVAQAEADVPASGYDTSTLYVAPVTEDNRPGTTDNIDASSVAEDASDANINSSESLVTPSAKISGYLVGDAQAPNGQSISAGIAFPMNPVAGTYFLRLDYLPNRLFRYDGRRWIKIEDGVRTNLTPGPDNKTLRSTFTNNTDERMFNAIAWDAIRAANVYTPSANASTISFNMTSKAVVTKISYNTNYGVRSYINGVTVTNTKSNVSGNVGFTITSNVTITAGDLVEYTIYANVVSESVSLSQALRPLADN